MKQRIAYIIVFCLIMVFPVLSAVTMNDLIKIFPEDDGSSIENNVINGASEFLSSYSGALLIFNSGSNTTQSYRNSSISLEQIEIAIKFLSESKNAYETALEIAKKSEYVFFFQDRLKEFSYQECINEFKLDQEVANEVVYFLKNGNVLGLYEKNIHNLDAILIMLESLQEKIKANLPIQEETLTILYEQYNYAALFGNYATLLGGKAFNGG